MDTELSSNKKTFMSLWFSWGVRWRSSYWFVTFVVWLGKKKFFAVDYNLIPHLGVLTDLIVYSIIVPVIPFELEHLGYSDVSTLTGWLMFSYVRSSLCSGACFLTSCVVDWPCVMYGYFFPR